MSIVACRIKDGKIYIAADSMVTSPDGYRTDRSLKTKKIFKIRDDIVIAGIGIIEELNILKYSLEETKFESIDEKTLAMFMSEFYRSRDTKSPYPRDRDCASENRYIIIVHGMPFYINQMFVSEIKNGSFVAIGHGDLIAIGSMEEGHMPKRAVETVCRYSAFCALPVISYEVEYYDRRSKGKK